MPHCRFPVRHIALRQERGEESDGKSALPIICLLLSLWINIRVALRTVFGKYDTPVPEDGGIPSTTRNQDYLYVSVERRKICPGEVQSRVTPTCAVCNDRIFLTPVVTDKTRRLDEIRRVRYDCEQMASKQPVEQTAQVDGPVAQVSKRSFVDRASRWWQAM